MHSQTLTAKLLALLDQPLDRTRIDELLRDSGFEIAKTTLYYILNTLVETEQICVYNRLPLTRGKQTHFYVRFDACESLNSDQWKLISKQELSI